MSPAHESFLVAQAGTALGAAASQDLAAVGGSHSLAEAMDFVAMLRHLLSDFRPPCGGIYSTPPETGGAVSISVRTYDARISIHTFSNSVKKKLQIP